MSYNDTVQRLTRAQRHGSHGSAAKDMLRLLALVGMGAAAIYWWSVQSELTENRAIAVAFTAILVLAPPTLVSFLIPWSPGGMLLQKVNARTWGFVVVIGCSLFLLYYSYQIQWSWWRAQPVVTESGMVEQQVLVGIIGFIIIPALLWAPVSDDELKESLKQAHLVKRYELQTQSEIAILQATMLRAQQQAAVGFANLTGGEKAELVGVMQGIIGGIDRTIQEMAGNLNNAATVVYGNAARGAFGAPPFADDLGELMEYVATALEDSRMGVAEDRSRVLSSAERAMVPSGVPPHQGHVNRVTEQRQGWVEEVASIPLSVPSHRGHVNHVTEQQTVAAPDRTVPQGAAPYGDEYDLARRAPALHGKAWTIPELADALNCAPRTAEMRKAAWVERGWIKPGRRGAWIFTEEGGR